MLFIDANVFLAYDNTRDVHHARAVLLWEEIESAKYGQYFSSDYVFNEVIGVTLRKHGKERATLLGNNILQSIVLLNIDEHLFKNAWNLFLKGTTNLSFVDCTHLAAMQAVKSTTISTFDREFEKIPGIVVVC